MLPYFWYILKAIICSGILFGYYWLFLRNKIFHQYNRFYLLASLVLSLLLPLIKIDFWQQNTPQQSQVIKVLQVVSAGDDYMNNVIITANKQSWSIQQLYPIVYWAVCAVLFLVLLQTVFAIRSLLKKYPVQLIDKISFVNTEDKSTPFSFLKYIFWNTNIDIGTPTGKQIFKHELVHIQEKHTYDKLFTNIILVFFWCNPFFWLYRKELNMIHEFIADKKAVEDSDTAAFAAMILQAAYPQHRFQIANNFFYSPIKRRLLMLTKNNNPRVNYIGRVMVLPLALLIFAAFTFKAKTASHIYNGKKITVVIDAGHGGQDAGARSADNILEKDLTLAIAKKVKELNSNDAIEIVLSREEDIYIGPAQAATFAKSKNADLLISFHIDNGPKESANKHSGMSVWVPNDEYANAAKSKVLASAIINEFSNNYGIPVMSPPSQRQKGIWIIQSNSYPAVLVEAGYINNSKDLAYLKTEAAKETIAKNVLAAIEKFANSSKQDNTFLDNAPITDTTPTGMYVNVKHAGTDYLNTDEYKNKALVIVDSKEIGNVGENYIKNDKIIYSSLVIYNPTEARKIYGDKGKYGVIKLTKKEAIFITADSIFFDDKAQSIKLTGSKTKIDGNLSRSIIYIDGKLASPDQLNNISPGKISSVSILKGDNLDGIIDSKGKTSVINVYLKPDDMQEVVVSSVKEVARPVNIALDSFPKFYFGDIRGTKAAVNFFKKQTEVRVSGNYKFVSAVVYFSGNGYKNVVMATLTGNSLSPIRQFLDKCESGTVVTFDNIKVSDKDGMVRVMDGKSYTLFSGDEVIEVPNNQVNASIIEMPINNRVVTGSVIEVPKDKKATGTVVEMPINRQVPGSVIEVPKDRLQNDDKIFVKTEIAPQFTGGDAAWKDYLSKNLKAITPLDEGWKAGTYTLFLKFIVHADGSVSDVRTENYQGTKTAMHCIEVIKNTPKWQPAIQNGHKVNAYKRQPITFVIDEQ